MGFGQKAGSFALQCRRVWHVLKKPTLTEWGTIAKVSAIGIVIIGFVGFSIDNIMTFISDIFA